MSEPPPFVHRVAESVQNSVDWQADSSTRRRIASAAKGLPPAALAYLATRVRTLLGGSTSASCELPLGFRMDLDLGDAPQLYMYLFGIWEPSQTALIQRILRPGRVFVDIGAHVGYYTLLAAASGARVVALEPDSAIASMLRANVVGNGFDPMVDIHMVAVAADSNGRTLYRGPRHNRGLTSTSSKWNLKASGTVPSAPIGELLTDDDLSATQIVKIDVEGAEPAVVRGLGQIAYRLPHDVVILLELSPRWWDDRSSVDAVLAPLTESGYKLWTVENSYSPLRYLAPGRVFEPEPIVSRLSARSRRYDLLLARDEGALVQ